MVMETLPSGSILHGRYRIERILGSGGFGHVYLAVDLQSNSQYALKEYLVTGASGKAQLEHEARVLSHLTHKSLPIFEAAFDERGRYYVVLGYIEGSDLTDYIRVARQKNEVIPLERILIWLLSICDAVSFLHSQNPTIIHRDIKPDNIRITPDGTAILVDLGNAKATADGARTLFFIRHQGTPGYAPLEQYPGGTGTDARSDVYALGGTLYFALTTHEPPSVSTRNTSISSGQPDLPTLQEVLAQNPPETSLEANSVRQFRLGVSKPSRPAPRHSRHIAQLGLISPELLNRLNSIIRRAMAMKPKDRYQSVAELSHDLRLVLAALQSSPPTPPAGAPRPVDPHSTQPDLPMLFESLQNPQQGSAQQGQSSQTPEQQPSPFKAAFQCPRCGKELIRPAAFCPHCGAVLNIQPPKNAQQTTPSAYPSSAPAKAVQNKTIIAQDAPVMEDDQTILSIPHSSPGSSSGQRTSTPARTPAPTTPEQTKNTPGATPPASQFTMLSASPLQAPARPFLQNSHTQPDTSSAVKTTLAARTPAPSLRQPGNAGNARSQQSNRALLLPIVIILVVILIIAALVLLFMVNKGQHASLPLIGMAWHANFVQVFQHERHISFCALTAAAYPDPGIW